MARETQRPVNVRQRRKSREWDSAARERVKRKEDADRQFSASSDPSKWVLKLAAMSTLCHKHRLIQYQNLLNSNFTGSADLMAAAWDKSHRPWKSD